MNKPVAQAKDLLERIHAALDAFDHHAPERYDEDEVLFRHESIRGILLMARNDVYQMHKEWTKEDDEEIRAMDAIRGYISDVNA